jgi:capsular polysaccharide biosynthesis protein
VEIPGQNGEVPLTRATLELLVSQKPSLQFTSGILIGGRPNFGHFLYEFLPKIFLASEFLPNDIPFLVSDDMPSRFLDILNLLGINRSRCIFFPNCSTFEVEELYIVSSPAFRDPTDGTPTVDFDLFNAMVNRIKGASIYSKKTNSNLYSEISFVTRKNEKWRRIKNEDTIVDMIRSKGSVDVEDPRHYTIEMQLERFMARKYIFSPLGGASPFAMFASQGTKLIEFTTELIRGDWAHKVWCTVFGNELWTINGYYNESCENDGSLLIDRDFLIDCKRFEKTLLEIL